MPIPPIRPKFPTKPSSENKNMNAILKFVKHTGDKNKNVVLNHLTLDDIRYLLEDLKQNMYNHKHELYADNVLIARGYSAIRDFYRSATTLQPVDDYIINPELQQIPKMNFIHEVDIMRLVTEIQTLSSKPGNEKDIHTLSTVLKYVLEPESFSTKPVRGVKLYEVRYMYGQHPEILEVLACDHQEALEMFYARKIPHSMVHNINVKK